MEDLYYNYLHKPEYTRIVDTLYDCLDKRIMTIPMLVGAVYLVINKYIGTQLMKEKDSREETL